MRPGSITVSRVGLGLFTAVATGCGGNVTSGELHRQPSAHQANAPAAATAAGQRGPVGEGVKQSLLADVRKRAFKPEDFTESESNRDPFRSFLGEFSGGQSLTTQYKILLPKYALDELRLMGIIGPPTEDLRSAHPSSEDPSSPINTQARAMFLDPTGMGVAVERGDHLSKADAKIVRISPEKGKVYVEIKTDVKGRAGIVERVLELHQAPANFEEPVAP